MNPGPTLEERFEGCFLGLAIGDALGYPTEFLSWEEIQKKFGSQGIQDLPGNPALHSDDTQMSLAVASALVKSGKGPLSGFMESLSGEFLAWFRSPENNRAPGNTSIKACENLERGIGWEYSGILQSKGCGANMRVAPIGLLLHHQPDRLRLLARASALITHGHPTALVAAEVTAFCVAWAVEGMHPAEYLDRIQVLKRTSLESWNEALPPLWERAHFENPRAYLEEGWTQLLEALGRVPETLRQMPADICQITGGGWVAEETLAAALACVLMHPLDYSAAIRVGANTSGDSDSIATIAGAISGAWLGTEALPKDWKKRIENRLLLQEQARSLFCLHESQGDD
jgi:ADP-ribosylglycohydrolase